MRTKVLLTLVATAFRTLAGDGPNWYWTIPTDELWLNVAAAPLIVVAHPATSSENSKAESADSAMLSIDEVLKGSVRFSSVSVSDCPDHVFVNAGTTNIFFLAPAFVPLVDAGATEMYYPIPFGPVPFSAETRRLVAEEVERQQEDLARIREIVTETTVPGLAQIRKLVAELAGCESERENAAAQLAQLCRVQAPAIMFELMKQTPSNAVAIPPPSIRVPNPSDAHIPESHRLYLGNSIPEILSIIADCGIGCGRYPWIYYSYPRRPDIDESRRWLWGTFLVRWASRRALHGEWSLPAFVDRFQVPSPTNEESSRPAMVR